MQSYTIEASFSAEVTIPGDVAYSSNKSRASLTIGQVVEAGSEDEARDVASLFLARVAEDVKLALIVQAPGTELFTDENGVVQVGLSGASAPKGQASAPRAASAASQPTASAPSASGEFTPLSHGKDRYTVQWNGQAVTLFDNRESKTGKQPDFKIPDLGDDGAFWLEGRNGPNKAALALAHQIDEAIPA
jgi:hypothetical protein